MLKHLVVYDIHVANQPLELDGVKCAHGAMSEHAQALNTYTN